jgi:hypothetical protein
LTKWLVYSESGRPASQHTLQKGVGGARVEEDEVFLLVAEDDEDDAICIIDCLFDSD